MKGCTTTVCVILSMKLSRSEWRDQSREEGLGWFAKSECLMLAVFLLSAAPEFLNETTPAARPAGPMDLHRRCRLGVVVVWANTCIGHLSESFPYGMLVLELHHTTSTGRWTARAQQAVVRWKRDPTFHSTVKINNYHLSLYDANEAAGTRLDGEFGPILPAPGAMRDSSRPIEATRSLSPRQVSRRVWLTPQSPPGTWP